MRQFPSLLLKKDISYEELNKIIALAKTNNDDAMVELSEYVYSRVYSYVYYRVNHREDTEDLVSEIVLKVIRALPKQRGNFNAWIYKIAKNAIIDFYRRRGVRSETSLSEIPYDIPDQSTPVSEIILTKEKLRKALSILTEEQQRVIILKFIEGYTNPEIAETMGKSIGAVKLLQFRALKSLKEFFKKKGL